MRYVDSPLSPESHSGSYFIGFMFFGGGCSTNRGPLPKVERLVVVGSLGSWRFYTDIVD